MARIYSAIVRQASTTVGIGAYTVAGTVTGHQTFADRCTVADVFRYMAREVDGSGNPTGAYEYGTGTYSAANTITRTAIIESSNADAAVSWGAGTKIIDIVSWVDAVLGQNVDSLDPVPVTETKPSPVDGDQLVMLDSADSGAPKLVTKAQLLAGVSGGGSGGDWTYVFLESDHVNSTTTRTDSALAFTPAADSHYEIEVRLYLQSAATTTGARPGITWPSAGVEQNAAWMMSPNTATAFSSRFWGNTAAAHAAATGVPVANEDVFGAGWALLRTGASPSGDFTITLASEIAASEARIMANSFLRYRLISPAPAATAPAAFTVGQWTSTPGDTEIVVNITALPSDGGSAITALQYTLNGSTWTSFVGTGTGSRTITGLTNDTSYPVQIRAVNAIGNGTASDTKNTTPVAASGETFVRFATLVNMTESGDAGTGWDYAGTVVEGYAGGSDYTLASGVAGGVTVGTGLGGNTPSPLLGFYTNTAGVWNDSFHCIAYPFFFGGGPEWQFNGPAFTDLVTTVRAYVDGDDVRIRFDSANGVVAEIARAAAPDTWLEIGAGTITRAVTLYPRLHAHDGGGSGATAVFTAPFVSP